VRVGDHAAEIIGVSDRHMRRWERYEEFGYDGLSLLANRKAMCSGDLPSDTVFGLFGSADMRMVLEMSFTEWAAGSVQQPTMVSVFERVAP
jgi:hypothetical protein